MASGRMWRGLVGAALLALVPACLAAQTSAQQQEREQKSHYTDADQKELSSYTISVEKVRKLQDAASAIEALEKNDPALKTRWDTTGPGKQRTLADATQVIDAQFPQMSEAIHKTGLTTHEYVVGVFSTMQTYLIVAMKRSGYIHEYPDNLSPANTSYVADHWSELQKILEPGKTDQK